MADNFNPLQFIKDRDEDYAKAIRGSVKATSDPGMMEGIMGGAAGFAGIRSELPKEAQTLQGRLQRNLGVATRYAVPAFGVTAAGIALADLAGYFGGSPDQPEEGQLGLNNGEMSALGLIAAAPAVAGVGGLGAELFRGNEDIEQAAGQGRAQAAAMQADMDAAYGQANSEANRAVAKAGRQRDARNRVPRSSRRR